MSPSVPLRVLKPQLHHLAFKPGVSKLWPSACYYKSVLLKHIMLICYMLTMAVFMLQPQSWVVQTETWSSKLKNLWSGPLLKGLYFNQRSSTLAYYILQSLGEIFKKWIPTFHPQRFCFNWLKVRPGCEDSVWFPFCFLLQWYNSQNIKLCFKKWPIQTFQIL